jgi:hypothetical protein
MIKISKIEMKGVTGLNETKPSLVGSNQEVCDCMEYMGLMGIRDGCGLFAFKAKQESARFKLCIIIYILRDYRHSRA